MLSFNPFPQTMFRSRAIRWAIMLVGLAFLSACSLAPLYGRRSENAARYELSYGTPATRLEQIVYQDLVARLGRSDSPEAYKVTVAVSSSNVSPGTGSIGLSAHLIISTPDGSSTLFDGTRTASATYVGTPQSAATQQAANDTSERAAHQLAESVRLTIMSVLAQDASGK